ncbi:MAG: response regulator [Gemmatimonadetes bacterium]|nr:response regulator [Gemmatimonadota bacterium]MCC7132832.1 response regulator [Gemmatimonadales bacterium]
MALNVLIVDDDATTRKVLSRLLEKRFGAVVREAVDGLAGFLAADAEPPDLVLLDVAMPIVDGPDLLAKLRADPRFASLPVITISAAGERDVVMRMIELGVADYLRKPLNLAAVEKRLVRVLTATGHLTPETMR